MNEFIMSTKDSLWECSCPECVNEEQSEQDTTNEETKI